MLLRVFCAESTESPEPSQPPERSESPSGDTGASRKIGDSSVSLVVLADLPRVPCFREALLRGAIGGFTLTAFRMFHDYRKLRQGATRKPPRIAVIARIAGFSTVDFAIRAVLAFSALSWVACRYNYRQSREQIRSAMKSAMSYPEKSTAVHETKSSEPTVS
ncbi:hypothetical protein CCYA_CCYA06G1791 [Cyanidiococcus yangmingshanensis]|nr:hypothetical protein CCYA_CCYA06G1791 [Cyanidiococcus yangmingshanensis]